MPPAVWLRPKILTAGSHCGRKSGQGDPALLWAQLLRRIAVVDERIRRIDGSQLEPGLERRRVFRRLTYDRIVGAKLGQCDGLAATAFDPTLATFARIHSSVSTWFGDLARLVSSWGSV